MEKMGALGQRLVIDKVAEEGTLGADGLAHRTSRENIISLTLQNVK